MVTTFDLWIYKNNFRFNKGFSIALTIDEHIHFYLNYYSEGFLTMYYQLELIQMHIFTLFLSYM